MPSQPYAVSVRQERLTLPTYPALAPDPNPMFFETRNVQGSKGNIYPHPFIDQISSQKVDRDYHAIILENEYLKLVLLPELGGRIFSGLDKTNGRDFFYRHQVIKPALIGTFGPWISGGVEFNWPQHHRPSTFDPTDFAIQANPDGSQTVWMGEHEPLNRTRGMVGVTLYPGQALVETKVRLFNRTPFPQTFLWWANAGVPIHDQYQVIFPPDVHYALYHSKNPVIEYPLGKGPFAGGNDYGAGTDLSWWVNTPGATSFFAAESKYEFFGGYDHRNENGVAHVADTGISSGKKYFIWANGPFGHQWQKNLYDRDEEGEYLELMAGVYTDNQPDFSWIMPYETRTFSQFWLPVQKIGGMKNANTRAAVNLDVKDGQAFVGVYATAVCALARVTLAGGGQFMLDQQVDVGPGQPFTMTVPVPADLPQGALLLTLRDASGAELIRYQAEGPWEGQLPEPYQPPAEPPDVKSSDELFLIGQHLEQYRHPGLDPERYWREALRRDPGDARCNLALGKGALRRGDFATAEQHLRAAVQRLTWRNANPYDGEAHYHLGLCLHYQGRLDDAYRAFYKSTWNYAWQAAGFYSLAQIDCARRDWPKALAHLDRALQVNTENAKARGLKAALLRRAGQREAAGRLAAETVANDPLDFWARYEVALSATTGQAARLDELNQLMRGEPQTYLDIALDYAMAGLDEEAARLLLIAAGFPILHPMVAYALSFLARRSGQADEAADWQQRARQAAPEYCFPWRLEEQLILEDALRTDPRDARASYYLGNLLYDKKRYAPAVALWQTAARLEPGLSYAWRNLGLAAYNRDHDLDAALACFGKAAAANPADPRLFLEQDFLLRRKAVPPEERLARCLSRPEVVAQRDDLQLTLMALYNRLGQPEQALVVAHSRSFHPWEGGEGAVSGQYTTACWLLGRAALEAGQPAPALAHFQAGLNIPPNLGEIAAESERAQLIYYAGLAQAQLGQADESRAAFQQLLAAQVSRPARVGGPSLVEYYQALALRQLGQETEARAKLLDLQQRAAALAETGLAPNYFYSGNPNPTFEEDPKLEQRLNFRLLVGLACVGLGDTPGARGALAQVLAADPANLAAHEALKRLA